MFWDQWKADKGLHIAGLISNVSEEIASESAEKLPLSTTPLPLSFVAPSPGYPMNICINLVLPESGVIGLHAADSVGLSSFRF